MKNLKISGAVSGAVRVKGGAVGTEEGAVGDSVGAECSVNICCAVDNLGGAVERRCCGCTKS